tara:strand:- start:123 stop:638 length:516 start_codon:yes stop_codon:yes gene_type:complete
MPTTTAAASSVTSNTITADRWFVQDGFRNATPASSMADIGIAFANLSVPAGSTIQGFELSVHGQGNGGTTPGIYLNNGTSDSSTLPCNSSFSKTDTTRTYGASNNLWGLSWTPTTAQSVVAVVDMSTMTPGSRFFFDFVQMTITYAAEEITEGKLILSQGLVTISAGKITL